MSIFVIDVEADGPVPGLYSMVSFAAVLLEPGFTHTFKGFCAPISNNFEIKTLAVSKHSREEHLLFEPPQTVMPRFSNWVKKLSKGKTVLLSDNPTFDGAFMSYYLHAYTGANPFGNSARRIGEFCAGLKKAWTAGSEFKKLRSMAHTHDPLDDARGNAEAFVALCRLHSIELPVWPYPFVATDVQA